MVPCTQRSDQLKERDTAQVVDTGDAMITAMVLGTEVRQLAEWDLAVVEEQAVAQEQVLEAVLAAEETCE